MNEHNAREIYQLLEDGRPVLERLDSFTGLERWRDTIVQDCARRLGGCDAERRQPADPEDVRSALAKTDESWSDLLTARLQRMRALGVLQSDADPDALATGIMAAFEGGHLLARVARDVAPMQAALDMAIGHVRTWGADHPKGAI